MAKIIVENTNKEFKVADGSSLANICETAGIPFACNEGVCGACVIEVLEGMENLSPFTDAEADFLGELDRERLACQCSIKSGTVKIRF